VPLPEIDHDDVLAAIAEFDRQGQEAVREAMTAFGFRPSRDYFINRSGRLYDSKIVVALAARARTGTTPRDSEFDGGDRDTADLLRRLGFTVTAPGPDWSFDELVLACDLVAQNGWRELTATRPEVVELSALLRRMSDQPVELRSPRFRSLNSVSRKTTDIATAQPGYGGQPTRGGRLDREVLQAFRDRPAEMHARAVALRELIERGDVAARVPDVDADDDGGGAEEGGLLERRHLARERDPKLRHRKLDAVRRAGQPIACEVCRFDFSTVYGERGRDYIEVHHRVPLHVSGRTQTALADLALLCSNCHRMIHRGSPWLTVEELSILVAGAHLE
jgi:5-methylcytosine-specific restriction protein A